MLVRQGVVTHYLPLGPGGEKGIDVWLALEAFELAVYKRFDVSVLVACDGDFLPLVRKLNTIGTRVMLLAWDFKFTDQNNQQRETRTAQVLLDEVTYPVMMAQIIDDRSRHDDSLVNNLFVPHKELTVSPEVRPAMAERTPESADIIEGSVHSLKEGYGFIRQSAGTATIFFFYAEVQNTDFNNLKVGDLVRYRIGQNQRGACAVAVELVTPGS